jgi:hypothetical protein
MTIPRAAEHSGGRNAGICGFDPELQQWPCILLCSKLSPCKDVINERSEVELCISARDEAPGVRQLRGAPTTVLVGASSTDATSNEQPDVKKFKAGTMGEELSAPSEPGRFLACHCYICTVNSQSR